MIRCGEGGRAGLRPAEWENWTLTHKPQMRLFFGLWARVQLSHPREARATAPEAVLISVVASASLRALRRCPSLLIS